MEKQFVTFDIAKDLKELGFDECCLAVYFKDKFQLVKGFNINNVDLHVANEFGGILAPLWQQVFDWFANTHKIFIEIRFADKKLTVYEFCVYKTFEDLVQNTIERIGSGDDRKVYPTYNEAREQAILKAIELCKK